MKRDFIYLGIAVVFVFWFKSCYDSEREAKGEAQFQLRILAADRANIADSLRILAAKHKTDTIRLTKVVKERIPVIEKVTEFIDRDVPVPVEVVKEVIKADSQVIQACHAVINTCEQQKAVLMTDIRNANEQIRLLRKGKGVWQTIWEWLSKLSVGFFIGKLA